MKLYKFVGQALIISVSIAVLTGVFSASLAQETQAGLYQLSGLGFLVFGIWGGVLLIRIANAK